MSVERDNRRGAGGGRVWRYTLSALLILLALGFVAYDRLGLGLRDPARLDRALRLAIVNCQAVEVHRLIGWGADPNRTATVPTEDDIPYPRQGSVPLQAYVRCDTPDTLQALVDGGADLGPHLRRLANLAMAPARPDVLSWLLTQGFDPNQRWLNAEGWETLTHRAARHAQADVLAVLLHHGADPGARDSEGVTPLGRLRLVIARQSPALRNPGAGRLDVGDAYHPEAHFADVIAMLQEAGGTE